MGFAVLFFLLGGSIDFLAGAVAAVALGTGLAVACKTEPASAGGLDIPRSWKVLLALFLLPFALVAGAFQLALLQPGTVRMSDWQFASFVAFLVGALPVMVLLMRSRLHRIVRLVAAAVATLVLTSAAFFPYMPNACEPPPAYIGLAPKPPALFASCG